MAKWICAAAACAVVAGAAAAAPLKVGYVDLQRALNESEAGKEAKAEFKRQVDRLQAELQKEKEALDALKEELEKKALVMKEEERRNLEKEYRRRLRSFERKYKDSQDDLQLRDSELTQRLLGELHRVISRYGREHGYTLILEKASSSVLYGAPEVDLTDEIIAAYDAERRKGKRAKGAGGGQ